MSNKKSLRGDHMKDQYKRGKQVVKFSAILFLSAFVVAIATDNVDVSTYMIMISWGLFIVGCLIIAFSPEEKERSARKRAKYEKVRIERQKEQKIQKEQQKEFEKYKTFWIDVEMLDIENKMRKSFLIYSTTGRDGTVKTHRTNIKHLSSGYDLNQIISVEHIGNFTKGWLRPFSAEIPLFIITYYDGSKQIIKAREGSKEYRDLLSFEGKSPREVQSRVRDGKTSYKADAYNKSYADETGYNSISNIEFNYNTSSLPHNLKTNELPQGEYLIGKDIPTGTYDFFVVYGSGGRFDLAKYDDNGQIINGTWKQFHWIGLKESYENKELIHIQCDDGYTIKISGNVIMRIAKSQEIKIDL